MREILVIEDNRHDAAMILEAMQEQGIGNDVCVLRNGADALDYIFGVEGCLQRPDGGCPRFILLDLKLPKVGGMEVLSRLKSDDRTRDIPVIVFTSSNEARDRTESSRLGANSYVVKPLGADLFSRTVVSISDYWLMMNRTPYRDA